MESEEFGSALKYSAVDIEKFVVILVSFNPILRVRALILKHLAAMALNWRSLLLNGDYVTTKLLLNIECSPCVSRFLQ